MENGKPVNPATPFAELLPRELFLIVLLALFLRVWGISFGLPGLDHGDETEVVNHALRFGSGDLNPHRFQYGSLLQYTLFFFYGLYFCAGYILGWFSGVNHFAIAFIKDPTVFYLLARGFSALLGAATVYITYLLGVRTGGRRVGVLAALFLAVSYQHAVHSHYATVDTALAFLFALATYQSLMVLFYGRLSRYCMAGFSIGLTLATKLNGIFALVPFAAAHFLRGGKVFSAEKLFSRKFWLGLGAVVAGHFIASPYFYIDMPSALSEVASLRSLHAASGITLFAYLHKIGTEYWGMPLGILCLAGVFRYLITSDKRIALISLTTAAVFCFASLHRYVEAKYLLYVFPLCAVLGALLLNEVCRRLRRRYLVLIALMLVIHPLSLIVRWDYERAQKSITLESKEWIEKNIPVNARILLDNVGNGGPKLAHAPDNLRDQYRRAREHRLLKAEYLKLQLAVSPDVYYDITPVDSSAGFREDDYRRYRLWQDTEQVGHPEAYYRERGYEYLIITDRHFSQVGEGFTLLKEFRRGKRGIRIYRIGLSGEQQG